MALALALVGVAAALAAFVLLTPLDVSFDWARHSKAPPRVSIRWLFGLVQVMPEPSAPSMHEAHARQPVSRKKPGRRRRRTKPWAMLRARGFLRGVLRLGGRLLRAVRWRRFRLRLLAGFADPAETGALAAVLFGAAAPLPEAWRRRVVLAPDFTREVFELEVGAEVRVVPLRIVVPVLAFALSPGTLRGAVALVTGRTRP